MDRSICQDRIGRRPGRSLLPWITFVFGFFVSPVLHAQTGQFSSPTAPPTGLVFEDLRGEVVNLETALQKPVAIFETSTETLVAVINEPDNRVELYDVDLGFVADVPVGNGPTALAQRPGTEELWVTCEHSSAAMVIEASPITGVFEVTHVVRPTISPSDTGATHAAQPSGIVFNSEGTRAWIAASATDAIWTVDLSGSSYAVTVIPGDFTHGASTTRMKEPRALAYVPGNQSEGVGRDHVYAASRRGANNGAASSKINLPPFFGDLLKLPDLSLSLHDVDILAVSRAAVVPSLSKRAVGSTLMQVAFHPQRKELVVSHMDARNLELIGERSFGADDGKVVRNRISFIDAYNAITPPAPGVEPSPSAVAVIELDSLGVGNEFAMPTDIAFDSAGRIYVAAYASNRVAVFDGTSLAHLYTLDTAKNPRGLAIVDVDGTDRLFVMSRGENAIESFALGAGTPVAITSTPLRFDATYDDVKLGRQIFNDAMHSGSMTTGCFSCHMDLTSDGLGWNLSKAFDTGTFTTPPVFLEDEKLTMVTQDLRGIAATAPYHWRGEQKDLVDFNGAFVELLGGAELGASDFEKLESYVFSAQYPPNPFQQMNRTLTAQALDGLDDFLTEPYKASFGTTNCVDCHQLPHGTDGSVADGFIHLNNGGLKQVLVMDTPNLRGLNTKLSAISEIGPLIPGFPSLLAPTTGFGLFNGGNFADLENFMTGFDLLSTAQRDDVEEFLHEFDAGLAPAVSYSELLATGTVSTSRLADYLVPQAQAGYCDIAIRGRYRATTSDPWQPLGFFFNPTSSKFLSSRVSVAPTVTPKTVAEILLAATEDRLHALVMGVPVGSGARLGVDRDRDRFRDHDEELTAGLDPVNPDVDGDELWDGEDPTPTTAGSPQVPLPQLVAGSHAMSWVTTNTAQVVWKTTNFSPSVIRYDVVGGSTDKYAGDPLVLPAGSNLWKRNHHVLIRNLKPDTTYEYDIRTRGQGFGATWHSSTFTFTTKALPDVAEDWIVAEGLTVTPIGSGSTTTFQIDVVIEDQDGNPVQGAEIHLTATRIPAPTSSGTLEQVGVELVTGSPSVPVVSDANGLISAVWDPNGALNLESGDTVSFVLPMAWDDPATSAVDFVAGIELAGVDFNYSVTESESYREDVTVP